MVRYHHLLRIVKIEVVMNIDKFRDMRSSIVSKDDLLVYDELLAACEFGLLRAAYVLAWIAIVESLKAKIYALADLGDKRASNVKSNIEDGEKNHNSTDRTIFEGVVNCEIVQPKHSSVLNYLWEQRCLYAHPYQNTPTEGDVQHIVEKAMEITLSKELMYSRTRIDEFLDEEMIAFHLVPTIEAEREEYIKHHLSLVKEMHYAALFKKLFFLARKNMEDRQHAKLGYILMFIRVFVVEKAPHINDASFRIHDGIVQAPNTMWYVASSPHVWSALDENYKDELFRYLETCENKDVYPGLRSIKHLLEQKVVLTDARSKTYYKRLAKLGIAESWQYYVDQTLLLKRINSEWITFEWNDHAKFINWLHDTEESVSRFNDDFVKGIGSLLALCCNRSSYLAHGEVRRSELKWFENVDFKASLSVGFFNEDGAFKFAYNFAVGAIEFLSKMDAVQMDALATELRVLPFTNSNPHKDVKKCLREKMAELDDRWTDNLRNLLNERIEATFVAD